jgi:DNA replication protein DnaC
MPRREAANQPQEPPTPPQIAFLQDRTKTARELLAQFLTRLDAGEFSPYQKRIPDAERNAHHHELILQRGLRYAGCTLANYHCSGDSQRRAVAQISSFASDLPQRLQETNGGGIILFGEQGTGKDHLLFAALTAAIIDHGFTATWTDGIRMFHGIKAAIATNSTEREINRYVKPQILAISDPLPPKAELTDYEHACLRDIIERRYSESLSTWITTNVQSAQEAKEKLTIPLLGRLMDRALEIKCDWPGYRRPCTTSKSNQKPI